MLSLIKEIIESNKKYIKCINNNIYCSYVIEWQLKKSISRFTFIEKYIFIMTLNVLRCKRVYGYSLIFHVR